MAINLTPWNGLDVEKLKVWVHYILPLVYDDSLSYYEVLAKVGAKMNEVIEGLNANNEQVEKVTGFTIEQIQNLTLAFNNFQQSMMNRQEEFENRVLNSQQNFENQLKGDIANWEAETEEKFRKQYEKDSQDLNNAYAKFLADYKRQFGVVQNFGDNTTDVVSQKLITTSVPHSHLSYINGDETFIAPYDDIVTIPPNEFVAYANNLSENIKNAPLYTVGKTFAVYKFLANLAPNDGIGNDGGIVFLAVKSDSDPVQNSMVYIGNGWNGVYSWKLLPNTVEVFGDSPVDVVSQKLITTSVPHSHLSYINGDETFIAPYDDIVTIPPNEFVAYANNLSENIKNAPLYTVGKTFAVYKFLANLAPNDGIGNDGGIVFLAVKSDSDPVQNSMVYIGNGWNGVYSWKLLPNTVEVFGDSPVDTLSQRMLTKMFTHASPKWISDDSTFIAPYDNVQTLPMNSITGYSNIYSEKVKNIPDFLKGTTLNIAKISSCPDLYQADTNMSIYIAQGEGVGYAICTARIGEPLKWICTNQTANKKWLALGDSRTSETYFTNYTVLVANALNIQLTNNSVVGTRYKDLIEQINRYEDTPDIVTIYSGVNDFGQDNPETLGTISDSGTDTFYGAVKTVIETILNKWPAVHLLVITPAGCTYPDWGISARDSENKKGNTLPQFVQAIKECCELYAIKCYDNFNYGGYQPYIESVSNEFYRDGLHENANGYKRLAENIYPIMKNFLMK